MTSLMPRQGYGARLPDRWATESELRDELLWAKLVLRATSEELAVAEEEAGRLAGELEQLADNLRNLLHDSGTVAISLDQHLRVRWFTPNVGHLFGLLPRDVGRPLRDFAPKFRDPELLGDAAKVAAGAAATAERDVPDRGGERWFARRVLPYRRRDGRADGVMVTFDDVTARRAGEERARRLALHDALTGLPNRALLLDRLGHALAQAHRESAAAAVVLLDLDRFKEVNDTLGHHAGDELLRQVSRRVARAIRASDTLARLGGDEFALVLLGLRERADAGAALAKILGALDPPFALAGQEVHAAASAGVALFPRDGPDADGLLRRADLALYRAKGENGSRNRFRFFEPAMEAEAKARRRLEDDLRRALKRGGEELALAYQPQLDLAGDRVEGVEALARWRHPTRGAVPPAEFVPVAEATGLIQPLGAWVLREACRQAQAWQAEGLRLTVGVNVSPVQLRHPDALAAVDAALAASGLDPGLLELEITEGVLMETFGGKAEALLQGLAARGVRLAIDDFGTGYSSLAYLKRLPAQRIKIDRSFVRDIGSDAEDEAVVRAIVNLGHDLGKQVVAEGVETEAQLAFLRRLRCDAAQGFLLSRPRPAREVRRHLPLAG